MLKKFEVYNFKSFTNKTVFNIEKEKDIVFLEENAKNNLLKGILFIGPNASGKTNSINAIRLLLEIINKDFNLSKNVNIFNKGRMYVSYEFVFKNTNVNYKIEYDSKTKLICEELKVDENHIINTVDQSKIQLNKILENTDKNESLNLFNDYLKNSFVIDLYNSQQSESVLSYKNPKIIYTKDIVENINMFLDKYNFEFRLNNIIEPCEKEELFFERKGVDILLPFDMESIGNRTLIYLLPIIKKVIDNNGMLILDEFGSGMHNALEELLIRYFMKTSDESQMFLVSHSTNLISQNLLRPDQIVSVDYENNSSTIFKFSTEKPRSSQNLEKMYLGGVFGGLPNFNKK